MTGGGGEILGYQQLGIGATSVIVLHDWFSDSSEWDAIRPYLDADRFHYVFADLRGYGRSVDLKGRYAVGEAADDVVSLADHLGWRRFAIVGHSMSSLVALHLAQVQPDRISRAVMLTPPPPGGLGADAATADFLRNMALGDDEARAAGMNAMWGDRLSGAWLRYKLRNWRAAADPVAAAGYVAMFAEQGVPAPATPVLMPLLAVTGECDSDIMRESSVRDLLSPMCRKLVLAALSQCGHYPMQEMPPLLAATLERFLDESAAQAMA